MRATHLLLDGEPFVLDDHYASRLLNPSAGVSVFPGVSKKLRSRIVRGVRFALAPRRQRFELGSRRMRAQVVTRSRYAEDRLAAATAKGVRQYVLLGAGFDTYALRAPTNSRPETVFEVDHPDTQRLKRSRILNLGESVPEHLEFVPCDFEHQTLEEALAASSFDSHQPAILAWLGVTYYLSLDAIRSTLGFVASLAPKSELVLDYWSDQISGPADRALLSFTLASVAAQGESMHSLLTPDTVSEEAHSAGLTLNEELNAKDIHERYLEGRLDGLRVPEFAHLASLTVS